MWLVIAHLVACGGGPAVGQGCEVADDCYVGLEDDIQGDPVCLTEIQGGYCSHTCASDADCCAVSGECPDDYDAICESLESNQAAQYCFVSCDAVDGSSGGDQSVCDSLGPGFTCRNTGGGNGRHFCSPG